MTETIKINISKDANNTKSANFYNVIGLYVLNQQLKSGVIPSNTDGSFDPWASCCPLSLIQLRPPYKNPISNGIQ